LVGCTSQQPDGFLPLRAFKPLFSESADRGRSIIQVSLNALSDKNPSGCWLVQPTNQMSDISAYAH
jgi:hypothetical protein